MPKLPFLTTLYQMRKTRINVFQFYLPVSRSRRRQCGINTNYADLVGRLNNKKMHNNIWLMFNKSIEKGRIGIQLIPHNLSLDFDSQPCIGSILFISLFLIRISYIKSCFTGVISIIYLKVLCNSPAFWEGCGLISDNCCTV